MFESLLHLMLALVGSGLLTVLVLALNKAPAVEVAPKQMVAGSALGALAWLLAMGLCALSVKAAAYQDPILFSVHRLLAGLVVAGEPVLSVVCAMRMRSPWVPAAWAVVGTVAVISWGRLAY